MNTAIYMRVSTDKQDHKAQLSALLAWLRAQGLSRRDATWYRDHGHSSADTSRPALDRLMEAVRAGGVSRLVVWKLDRIGRWESDDFLIWRITIKRANTELVSLTEPATGFSTLSDRIVAICESEARSKWLKDHADRIRAGIAAKRAGRPWGGQHTSRISMATWEAIHARHRAGERAAPLAREYGITLNHMAKKLRRMNATATS